MAAKSWDVDYRYSAIRASQQALGEKYREDLFDYPGSFCLPAANRPAPGWNPGRMMLVALVFGFMLLIAGALIGTTLDEGEPRERDKLGEEEAAKEHNWPLMAIAGCCTLGGIVTFLLPTLLYRRIVPFFLGDRGSRVIDHAPGATVMATELSNTDTSSMKYSIDGDDHVLIVFDEFENRLMIEGTGARYQIRAADVESLGPFKFNNIVGAAITYRIDETTNLSIAIARTSLWVEIKRQLPFLFFWSRKDLNPILTNCQRTLLPNEESRNAV